MFTLSWILFHFITCLLATCTAPPPPNPNRDVPVTPNPTPWQGTSTWVGTIAEPAAPRFWDHHTVRVVAEEFWNRIHAIAPQESGTIVAALWIYGHGIFLGSIPHTQPGNEIIDGQDLFKRNAPEYAPLLWSMIENRRLTTNKKTSLWHAEDMAAYCL
ncbi:hypothetical protein EJ08DRAFT_662702 [Tothia fuscella]|uniref:Uncharacterized protein n=1 Tax=Tothia fuscella TaxID=1048955 RepID=A0A9P4NMZ6_9PEZI|nr:hypothetical protein EJ08DRAFT_662702 [Tothia fuscella]